MALGTVAAFLFAYGGMDTAEVFSVAVLSQRTPVRLFVITVMLVMLLEDAVLLDLFGDGGGLLAKFSRNGAHASAHIKSLFDDNTAILVHVFLIGLCLL